MTQTEPSARASAIATQPEPSVDISDRLAFPTDVVLIVLSYLQHADLFRASKATPSLSRICFNYNLITRAEVKCFHSKASFTEDTLGIGVAVEYQPDQTGLKNITTDLDIISQDAFDSGVRHGVWGTKFQFFLPLVLNTAHADRAFDRMKSSFADICRAQEFQQQQVITVLSTLMNSMVVELMMDDSKPTEHCVPSWRQFFSDVQPKQQVKRHPSEKAVAGYRAFHHLLLYMTSKLPDLKTTAQDAVSRFCIFDFARHKKETPDLGKFIVLLTLSDLNWQDVAVPFLREMLCRNVRWVLKEHGSLKRISSRTFVDQGRLDLTFKSSKTSLRLLMFQVYFLTKYGRPHGKTSETLLVECNRCLGIPSDQQKMELQKKCVEIRQGDSWDLFFAGVGMPSLTPLSLSNMLVDAVVESKKNRYHH